jgi:FkbM family methyltransferase
MLINLEDLIKKYNIIFTGILHVGAHECEELSIYEKYIPIQKILWLEALEDKVQLCKDKYPDIVIEQAVISDKNEMVLFNCANNGQSSSFLQLGEMHKYFHPDISYINQFKSETKMLKDIICNYPVDYNFLNLDIQGVELKALKGMGELLSKVDYIYTEVNSDYVYENCSLVHEIDSYLNDFGFTRVETKWWYNECWGDAFYIKTNL